MKKTNYFKILYIALPFIFYLFFALYDGVVMCVDSPGYISMAGFREPLYPLIIDLFRTIVGENNNYLLYVVIFQSLLLSYATFNLSYYIKEEYDTSNSIGFLIELILLFVSIFCRFFAKRGSMYSNCILSEAIAYPLFLLFFRYLLDYVNNNFKKDLVICAILSFLMVSTRKQMYVSLALLFICIIYKSIINKNTLKGIIKALLISLLIFVSCKGFDLCYMNIINNTNSTHTSDNRFLTTMIFYCSNREDVSLIKDDDTRELFLEIYDLCNENGYLKNSESGSWYDRLIHFYDNYDNIQTRNMWPMMEKYASNKYDLIDTNEIENKVDELNNNIINSLLVNCLPSLLMTIFSNFLGGLFITIAAQRHIFIYYAIVMYAIYIVMLVLLLRRHVPSKYSNLAILTLISIVCNIGIVSIVIFNQTRYTIYNMALFYIALLMMIYGLYSLKINKK